MSSSPASSKPLLNRTILVACSAKKMVELVAGLEAMGGNVLPFPVIEAKPIEDVHLMDQALASLQDYDWIIFTSAYGVRFFMQRLNECAMSAGTRTMPKICAIGPATAAAVKECGYETALIPSQFVAEGLLEALERHYGGLQNLAGRRILLPRAKEARELLPDALASAGARVDVVPCYKTVQAEVDGDIVRQLHLKSPDLMVFTSSSTIRNFIDILGPETGTGMLLQSTVAVLGPVTGKTADTLGKHAEIVPRENTVPALLKAIREYYGASSVANE
jgi:uroporphyrinogen III methyltransferase/synthase